MIASEMFIKKAVNRLKVVYAQAEVTCLKNESL